MLKEVLSERRSMIPDESLLSSKGNGEFQKIKVKTNIKGYFSDF